MVILIEIDGVNTALDASGNVIGYVLTVTAKDGSQGKHYILCWHPE